MAFKVELVSEVKVALSKLNKGQRAKAARQFTYLSEFGLTPANPSLKKIISTPFWEIRILGKDNIRAICIGKSKVIYILHLFIKKKQKTPAKEVKISLARHQALLTFDI